MPTQSCSTEHSSVSKSKVFMTDDNDPEMQLAYENARNTLRYCWRELYWEGRRIVPGLDLACVKAQFSDGENTDSKRQGPAVEQMWMGEVDFDGQYVSGSLLNSPNWLKTIKAGDRAQFELNEITDWMYAISGEVFGAYTVNLMRLRMGKSERSEHDAAWGLNFGDPKTIRVVPDTNQSVGFLKNWFGGGKGEMEEHPMSENMAPSLKEQIAGNPSMVKLRDSRGWTFLHQLSLAGSTASVKILLDAGADRNQATDNGMTALQLAKVFNSEKVVGLLGDKGHK
jgi:uncharacterized protein YegJ (DUF2314 family)